MKNIDWTKWTEQTNLIKPTKWGEMGKTNITDLRGRKINWTEQTKQTKQK